MYHQNQQNHSMEQTEQLKFVHLNDLHASLGAKMVPFAGYSTVFIDADGGGLIDDHVAVNDVAKIQMIDIIELHPNDPKTFGYYHHTKADNMSVIDKNTLKAVGQTVLTAIYQE